MIKEIEFDIVKEYENEMKQSMLTLASIDSLYGEFLNGVLVGWAGVKKTKSKYIFKTAFVRKEYRNKGTYGRLLRYRMAKYSDKPIETNCTPMSFNNLLRNKFKVIKEYKNGCKKLKHENTL